MTPTVPAAAAPPERFNILRLEAPERFQTVGRLYNRDGLAAWWVTESEEQIPEWFSQPVDDLLCVLRGAVRLVYADGRSDLVLETGDFYVLPAGTRVKAFRHRSSPAGPAIFLAVHRAFEPQPDTRSTG